MAPSWNPIAFWRNEWDGYSPVEKAVAIALLAAAIAVVFVTSAGAAEAIAPNNQAVWIAGIVVIPTTVATIVPLLIERAKAKVRKEERAEDKAALLEAAARAQEVAEQAKKAAVLLADSTAKSAEMAQSLSEKVDRVETVGKIVHTLVNSKLTVTTQKLRDKTARTLDLERKRSGSNVDIALLEAELRDLDAELSDRALAQAEVTAGIKPTGQPLPVVDNRTATATEQQTAVLERVASAVERTADKATK